MLFETYSGRMVDILNLVEEDLVLADMIVPLSRIGRYGNHTEVLYSVGLHTLICASLAEWNGESDDVIRYVLGHDLSESYLGDIPRPLKIHLPEYGEIEDRVQNTIWSFLGLEIPDEEMSRTILKYDNAVLYWEASEIKRNIGNWGEVYRDEDLIEFEDSVLSLMHGMDIVDVRDELDRWFVTYFSGVKVD